MNLFSALFFSKQYAKKVTLFIVLFSGLLISTGHYQFSAWSQIRFYNLQEEAALFPDESNEISFRNIGVYIESGDLAKVVQYPRYLLTRPIFWISEITGFHYNTVFSIIVLFNLLISALLVNLSFNSLNQFSPSQKSYLVPIFLVFLALSTFMNGRLSFSFLGFSTLIALVSSESDINKRGLLSFFILVFSLWLCSVSSGTFAEAMIFLLLLITWRLLCAFRLNIKKRVQLLPHVLAFLFGLPWLAAAIFKNIKYYGNNGFESVIQMVSHGYGNLFPSQFAFYMLVVLLAVVLTLFVRASRRYVWFKEGITYLSLCAILSVVLGVFGYSITAAFFPGFFLLGLLITHRLAFPLPDKATMNS